MGIIIEKSGDRRIHDRVGVDFIVSSRSTENPIGRAVNLCSGGMFIETQNRYKPGTKIIIDCSLPLNTLPVKAYCDVKWINDRAPGPLGIGVKFIGVYESGLNRINAYIEKCLKRVDSDTLSLADFIVVNDADIFKKTELFWEFIEDTNRKDFNKYGTPLKSASRNRALIRDKKSGRVREVIMMGTSNYLGLTTHPKVVEAAKRALEEHGTGTASVRLLSGTHEMHQDLERKLAELKDTEDAAVFPTGHMANMGCISSLLGRKDVALIDKNVHASILDGCGLSLGTFRTFRHSDTEHLRILLKRSRDKYLGKLIIVEGVDGIDGDLVPLPEICDLAEEFGAKVLVDEAHATGVIGERGKGTASHFNLEDRVDVFMDSLSKSVGGLGGYVASTREIIRYIKYYARTSFFSVSAPIPLVAAALAAIEVMGTEPRLIDKLRENIKYMKENLVNLGFNNVAKSDSAIMSTIIGDELTMRKMNKMVFDEGLYLEPIPYPAVPRGQERLRLRVMATHTGEDLDRTLEIMEKAGRRYGVLAKSYSASIKDSNEGPVEIAEKDTDPGGIVVREIVTEEEMAESVKFAWKVYQDTPAWVPYFLIKDRVDLLLGEKNIYFNRNVKAKRFIAEENGETVGTLSAFVDRRYTEYFGENTGFIGYFEALPSRGAAVESLLNRAFEFLRREGMTSVLAPVNTPLVFYGGGLLSGNYDNTPSLLQPYNPPYYHEYLLNAGLKPHKHLPHFSIDLLSPGNIDRFRSIRGNTNVRIRKLNKSKYEEETRKVLKIYNEAFHRLWKYTPFKEDEFMEFSEEFKDLVLDGLWLIAEVRGKDVAVVGGFPEAAPIFEKINGELGPSELASFNADVGGIKEGAIVIQGVLEKYKDMDMGLELLAQLCINMAARGYRKASCTWEVCDNEEDAHHLISKLGGVKDEFEWTIYERSLS